jgi:ferrous iron transport protein A
MLAEIRRQTTPTQTAVPLSLATRGQTVIIQHIRGGRRLRQRLLDLGLNQGARIRVLKNEMTGPLIVAVKEDGRLALGRSMTHHILVTETGD